MMSELLVEEPMTKVETLVQETFWYKGIFYMTDRYERADESIEKRAVEDAVSAPPNPAEDEPARATSAAEVPTLPAKTKSVGCSPAETAVATQPAMTHETGAAPDANRACVQPVEQTEEPAGTKADSGRKEPPTPPAASADSTVACGSKKSPAARPVSPKGGQRRSPRAGTQRKHSPRSRRPRCCHAGMCRSPRSCYEAYLHTTEFGQLLDPKDIVSWCYVCARCSTSCGYESVSSSPPAKDVPGIQPDRVPDNDNGREWGTIYNCCWGRTFLDVLVNESDERVAEIAIEMENEPSFYSPTRLFHYDDGRYFVIGLAEGNLSTSTCRPEE